MTKKTRAIIHFLDYLIRFQGNKIAYLRYLGSHIGENCYIYTSIGNFGAEPWLIEIGNNVTLTTGVMLVTHDGASRLFRSTISGMNPKFGNRFGTICIHDNSFVGVNTIILPGVSIGPNTIVGAASLVNRDVPPISVMAGNPIRHICSLDEYIEKYSDEIITLYANNRKDLRRELTRALWGHER